MLTRLTVPAARPALVRIAVGAYTLHYLGRRRRMLREVARTDSALFAPVGPVRVLPRPLPPAVADGIADATLVSTAMFTTGLAHPVTGRVHAALLTWTLAYRNSWSMVFHSDNLLVLHTVALAAGRSSDTLSLDALRRGEPTPAPHPRYGWPLELTGALSAAAYLIAGVAKVAGEAGWGWVRGDGLRRQVAVDAVRKELFGSSGGALARRLPRGVWTAMAVVSLAVELGAPLALADRRLGRLWAAAAFAMHWGILGVMGIRFRYQLAGVGFLPWFDVEKAFTAAHAATRPGAPARRWQWAAGPGGGSRRRRSR